MACGSGYGKGWLWGLVWLTRGSDGVQRRPRGRQKVKKPCTTPRALLHHIRARPARCKAQSSQARWTATMADDDEVDPLDAFMAEINTVVTKQKADVAARPKDAPAPSDKVPCPRRRSPIWCAAHARSGGVCTLHAVLRCVALPMVACSRPALVTTRTMTK